jgi:hypothetical protein
MYRAGSVSDLFASRIAIVSGARPGRWHLVSKHQ